RKQWQEYPGGLPELDVADVDPAQDDEQARMEAQRRFDGDRFLPPRPVVSPEAAAVCALPRVGVLGATGRTALFEKMKDQAALRRGARRLVRPSHTLDEVADGGPIRLRGSANLDRAEVARAGFELERTGHQTRLQLASQGRNAIVVRHEPVESRGSGFLDEVAIRDGAQADVLPERSGEHFVARVAPEQAREGAAKEARLRQRRR